MNNSFASTCAGKRILILGGSFQHCKVVEAAHRLGLTAYVTDYLESSPAKEMADVALMYDVKNVDGIVSFCRAEHIHGVISISLDPCQVPYQAICERLGVPCFGTKEQFRILTDKVAFKECCRKYGVDIIDTYSLQELEVYQTSGCIEEILPVLVKPADSRGSRGQTVCRAAAELGPAVEYAYKESASGDVVIEKYMEKKEDFTASYLFMEGKAILVRTGDRYVGGEDGGLDRVAIASASPSKHAAMYWNNVHDRVIRMLKGIGITNGPVFFQGFVDGDTIRLYDPGYRFSGGEYERLFQLATKIDLIQMLVQFAITGKFENIIQEADISHLYGMRIMQLCPTLKPGRIHKIYGVEEITSHEAVVTFSPRYVEGDNVPACSDLRRRYAEICILCKTRDKEKEALRFIQDKLIIENEAGENLICDMLNTDLI
ncbi:MAG: hypothetical protein NC543_11120 [bacterium]|nr:hypothetical protein [bacterium]MCM1374636.1 hypothetical protein [Muribaculum sp.]